jgi:hypothetical protein
MTNDDWRFIDERRLAIAPFDWRLGSLSQWSIGSIMIAAMIQCPNAAIVNRIPQSSIPNRE